MFGTSNRSRLAAIIAIAACLGACGGGGGGGGVGLIPAPPGGPGSPQPPAAGSNPLVAPQLTAVPESPIATDGGPSFDDPQSDTVFPLIMTAVDSGTGGDALTTQQGGTLSIDSQTGVLSVTLNNGALGVEDDGHGAILPNGQRLDLWLAADLDYASYGFWDIYDPTPEHFTDHGALVAGYVTPASAVPVSGTAVYQGTVTGQYFYPASMGHEYLFGRVVLTADFGANSVEGLMSNMSVTSGDVTLNGPINDIGFVASFNRSLNLFSGTTHVASMPGSNVSFAADAQGSITGRFFGPSAQEVGAVFTLSDGSHRLIGSFGAKQ